MREVESCECKCARKAERRADSITSDHCLHSHTHSHIHIISSDFLPHVMLFLTSCTYRMTILPQLPLATGHSQRKDSINRYSFAENTRMFAHHSPRLSLVIYHRVQQRCFASQARADEGINRDRVVGRVTAASTHDGSQRITTDDLS